MHIVKLLIENLSIKRRFRPLPKKLRERYHDIYRRRLNGFPTRKDFTIDGHVVCSNFRRIVVGDYGAYVEIDPQDFTGPLTVEEGQEWRTDAAYLERRGLHIKYVWYNCHGAKVYYQINTVKYADYMPKYLYVSVLDFDAKKNIN